MNSSCLLSPLFVDLCDFCLFLQAAEVKPPQLSLMWKHFHVFDRLLWSLYELVKKNTILGFRELRGIECYGVDIPSVLYCS